MPAQPEASTAPPQRARGTGRLAVKSGDGRTRIKTLFQEGCAKIRLPKTYGNHLEAVLINTAGGLTGGDRLDWRIEAAPETHTVLTTQACERIYRSAGDSARVHTHIHVGAGAHLDWLPQETILFEDADLDRTLEVALGPGASLTAIESVLIGRQAMGENALRARLRDNWRIRRDGRLLHAEATAFEGTGEARDALALLAGNRAFASILHIGPRAEALHAALRQYPPATGQAGTSLVGDRLVVRLLAPSGLAMRALLVPILEKLSGAGTLPRLWSS